jgi:AcrR family transcriptional regulator
VKSETQVRSKGNLRRSSIGFSVRGTMGIAERRERGKAQRRLDIVRAAEKVFLSKGYDDATMDEIAEEAELSKGTLYLYFKGKEDVHAQIVAKGMDVLFGLLKQVVDPQSNGMSKLQPYRTAS